MSQPNASSPNEGQTDALLPPSARTRPALDRCTFEKTHGPIFHSLSECGESSSTRPGNAASSSAAAGSPSSGGWQHGVRFPLFRTGDPRQFAQSAPCFIPSYSRARGSSSSRILRRCHRLRDGLFVNHFVQLLFQCVPTELLRELCALPRQLRSLLRVRIEPANAFGQFVHVPRLVILPLVFSEVVPDGQQPWRNHRDTEMHIFQQLHR